MKFLLFYIIIFQFILFYETFLTEAVYYSNIEKVKTLLNFEFTDPNVPKVFIQFI